MNLIYDRTQSDVDNAIAIRSKYQALGDWSGITEDEIAQLKRGTYTCFDDMNRVDAAVREIGGMLTAAGYPVRYTLPVPQPKPEYTPLIYIESTGTQYIDTGINSEYILTMTVKFTDTGNRNLMGQSSNAGNYFGSSADGYFELGGDAISSVKATEKRKITVISTKTDITLTVEQGDTIVRNKTAAADTNLIICGGVSGYVCNAKIWDCTISNISGDMIRDFVPAEKDGIIGLYDKISKKIYGNSGNGTFIAGGAEDYTELTYISSNSTQYIDTKYKPNNNTRVVCQVKNYILDSTNPCIFGSRFNASSQLFAIFALSTGYRSDYNTQLLYYSPNFNVNGILKIDKNKNVCILNDISVTNTIGTFSCQQNLYLFACNTNNNASNYAKNVQMYYCKIYDNGTLVRDFIPALQNGKIGLYDKVESQMYLNSGTGEFVAGEVVPQPEPEPEPVVTEFALGDIINYNTWRIYLDNVQAIREAYYAVSDTLPLPVPTAPLKFDGANAIEKLLFDVQTLYNAMVASYRKCGAFQSGTNKQHLPLQRSVT